MLIVPCLNVYQGATVSTRIQNMRVVAQKTVHIYGMALLSLYFFQSPFPVIVISIYFFALFLVTVRTVCLIRLNVHLSSLSLLAGL